MSESPELIEKVQDAALEAVELDKAAERHPGWHRQAAFTTLIMALLAALGGMLAGITASEALLKRTKEIVEVSYLEGDRVIVETLKSKHDILIALGETPDPAEVERVAAFESEMRALESGTAPEEALALRSASAHFVFALAVTLLSLGITLGGMAVIIERRWLWATGLLFGAAGAAGVGLGVLTMLS